MWMIVHANGYAMDSQNSRFDAILLNDASGRIEAVGSETELRHTYGSAIRDVLDVEGALVIPGFVDNHLHLSGVAEAMRILDLTHVTAREELIGRLRATAHSLPEGSWLLGVGWSDERIRDGMPSLAELSEAVPHHPLLLTRVCRHAYLVNQQAYQRAGTSDDPSDPDGGRYGRDIHGKVNGWLYDNAANPFLKSIPAWDDAKCIAALSDAGREALRYGITGVDTDDTRSYGGFERTRRIFSGIHDAGVRLRIHELVDITFIKEAAHYLQEHGHIHSEWFDVGAVKLFSDGALGGRTAWLSAPYADARETYGLPIYSDDALFSHMSVARTHGFPVAIHAIGDAALEQVLRILTRVPRGEKRDRIIHAQLIREDLVRQMRAFGDQLAVDIQPRFTVSDFPWAMERLGSDRSRSMCAWRSLLTAGLHLGGGSDAPIEPINPLLGIHAAVTRRPPWSQGDGYFPEESLTPLEALRLFTCDAVYASGRERVAGTLERGKWADLTILDRDIVHPKHVDDIRDAHVLFTVVGGEIAYHGNT